MADFSLQIPRAPYGQVALDASMFAASILPLNRRQLRKLLNEGCQTPSTSMLASFVVSS